MTWSAQCREAYANDLGAARPVRTGRSRTRARSIGCRRLRRPRCRYVAEWVGTKLRWALAADEAEVAALCEAVARCPDHRAYEPAA